MTPNRLLGMVMAGALVTGPGYAGAPPQQGKAAGERDVTNPVALAEVPAGQVVARVNGQAITVADMHKPLMEGYGLKVLLSKAQLDLARQEAVKKKVEVTKADVAAELDRTMKAGFKDIEKADYAAALEQLLARTGLSRGEFDMVIETNAILRKIAEPLLKDRITDENVREAYNARFGQTVQIRHIECANPQEALRAKNRIAAGEKFEEVARTMSHNAKTAPLGGELPVFSRQTAKWPGDLGAIPQGFRDWAFNAKDGDISDPIGAEQSYHILKLEKKIEPKVVKFEDQQ
ncbi:MAG TPA: peptidylprolyl isomerase, partial [Tepidisphaeraceae bacterium]|nr:peptidylprolyl isomerase [Tepidisphaeraceae bacterium]